MIKSGMETFAFGSGSKFTVLTQWIPGHHVEQWSWIQSDFAMDNNIEGCQNTWLKQQMPDGFLGGQGKPDWINNAVFFNRKNSGKFRKNNLSPLWEWQIPKRWLQAIISFNGLWNSGALRVAAQERISQLQISAPQSWGSTFPCRKLLSQWEGQVKTSCFPDYRYQAPADHWENLRHQLFSCNAKGRCQPREINFSWMCWHLFNLWDFSQHPKQHFDPPTMSISDTVCYCRFASKWELSRGTKQSES